MTSKKYNMFETNNIPRYIKINYRYKLMIVMIILVYDYTNNNNNKIYLIELILTIN